MRTTLPSTIMAALGLFLCLFGLDVSAKEEIRSFRLLDKSILEYTVVTPHDYDGRSPLPAIIAFPKGNQTAASAEWGLRYYWRAEAERRGYFVFSPHAQDRLFFDGGEEKIPEFLSRLKVTYNIRGNQFHAVGISNGGLSAFQAAARYPEHFSSILTIPGHVWQPSPQKYQALMGKCIVQIVGRRDVGWAVNAINDREELAKLGQRSLLEIVPNRVLTSRAYSGPQAGILFDMIEHRAGCRPQRLLMPLRPVPPGALNTPRR